MKSLVKTAAFLLAANLLSAEVLSADYRQNPFTLTYEGAITKNVEGKVNIHAVSYKLNNIDIAANVYTPPGFDPSKQYPAIVIAHPNGGVKEQATSPSLLMPLTKVPAEVSLEILINRLTVLKTSTAWRTSFLPTLGFQHPR